LRRTIEKDYNIQETIYGMINENSIIDKATGLISGVCIMHPESRNNRIYTKKAMNSVRQLAEGCKSFIDHGSIFADSSVKDMFGVFESPRRHGEAIYGNLNLLKTSEMYEKFLEIAERFPHTIGFSISARGKFAEKPDAEGREVVEDVTALRSIDLVGNPATTNGIFEDISDPTNIKMYTLDDNGNKIYLEAEPYKAYTNENNQTKKGGDNMITHFKSRIEGFDSLTDDGKEQAALEYIVNLEKLPDELAKQREDHKKFVEASEKKASTIDDLQKTLTESEEALKVKTIELDNFNARDKKAQDQNDREELVKKVLTEEKLDMKDAEGIFYDNLLKLQDSKENPIEDLIRNLIKDRKALLTTNPVTGSGAEQKEDEGDPTNKLVEWNKKTDEEKAKEMAEAMTSN